MCQHVTFEPEHNKALNQSRLTEENLRMHSFAQSQTIQYNRAQAYKQLCMASPTAHQYEFDTVSEDDDDEAEMENIALRKAASLEALQAYGGCFASGFLAMHSPLPWASARAFRDSNDSDAWHARLAMDSVETGSMTTASTYSSTNTGSPRPDSDTLSQTDHRSSQGERRWKWRAMGWKKGPGSKLQKKQHARA